LKYCIYIAILVGCIYSKPSVDHNFIFSLGASNAAYGMLESSKVSYNLGVSGGYFRRDTGGIKSGFGLQYILGVDQSLLDNSSLKNKNLFGLSVFSFIEIPLDRVSIGVRSTLDLGFSDFNFVFGPTFGYSFNVNTLNININYFKGCSDFINFSRFTDTIEARIMLPLKGKNN